MTKRILAVVLLFITSTSAWGWGIYGHKTVATIAYDNLTPATKTAVDKIIHDSGYNDSDTLAADGLDDTKTQSGPSTVTFVDLSTWADELRENHPNPYRDLTAGFHFIDIEVREPETEDTIEKWCDVTVKGSLKHHYCAVDEIDSNIATLKDASASEKQKFVALMFLVHLMGDIHQPLHCADDTDQGGNLKYFLFQGPHSTTGTETELHAVWDNLLAASSPSKAKMDSAVATLSSQLESEITQSDKTDWEQGTPTDWAWESFQIAKNKIYNLFQAGPQNVEIDSQGNVVKTGTGAHKKPVITQKVPFPDAFYTQEYRDIVNTQIKRAGLRLAYVLETTVGGAQGNIVPTKTPTDDSTPTASSDQVKVTKKTAKIYKAPNSGSEVIKVVSQGDVLDTVPGWQGNTYFEVKADGQDGYIYKGNVAPQ